MPKKVNTTVRRAGHTLSRTKPKHHALTARRRSKTVQAEVVDVNKRKPGKQQGKGRRPYSIEEKQVYVLAKAGCTWDEMADILEVSASTLERRFREIVRRAQGKLNLSVRRQQIKIMRSGSAPMAIWLGKNLLKQKDTHVFEGPGGPLQVDVTYEVIDPPTHHPESHKK